MRPKPTTICGPQDRRLGGADALVALSGVRVFQDDGDGLSRAYANPDGAVAGVTFGQLGRQGQDVSSSGGAERMPDGHRPAVGCELVIGNDEAAELIWKFPKHAESLCAERFVDFPHVDLLRRGRCRWRSS